MPASYLMSWEAKGRRWWKMSAGRRYVVSVRQLRKHFNEPTIPETKEGSYQWANSWWQGQVQPLKPESMHPLIQFENGTIIDDPVLADLILVSAYEDRVEPLPDDLVDGIIGKHRREELQRGVRELLNPVRVTPDRTVGHLIGRYLGMLLSRHKAGEISVGEFSNARVGLNHFRDWLGTPTPVEAINAEKWQEYYLHLIGPDGPTSVDSRRKHFRYARNFLTWLGDMGVITAPPNLDRRQYRFKGAAKAIPTISIESVKNIVGAAKGQLKLQLLLMLNCGFTQQDISELHPSEVDWTRGRIRRKRSKTGDHDKVPLVDYLLWAETFALLTRYRSDDPDRVLKTESGKAWVRDEVKEDGSRGRTDAIQSNYRRLAVKGKQPLKMLRKGSSTLLDSSPEHGRYAVHFLGHAPADVAHRHYINSNGSSFDAAVKWLGKQFGF